MLDAKEGCLSHTCGEGGEACRVSGQEDGEGQEEATSGRETSWSKSKGKREHWDR